MAAETSQLAVDDSAKATWTDRSERGSMVMLRLMTWISLRLGRKAGRVVLAGISAYFLLLVPQARRASKTYLTRALGRPPGLTDLYRHIHSFASTIHDRVYLLNERFDLFDIELIGEPLIRDVLAKGQGAFLMGAHLGSFEVVRALGRNQPGLRIAMLMYEHNARKINAALAAINPAAVQDIVPLGQLDSMIRVQSCLEEGMVLGILGDRTLANDAAMTLPFLGQPATFALGPMRLAAMLKRPVLFMTGLYLGDNRYAIHFERLADFTDLQRADRDAAVRAAVSAYAACLERHCRATPYNWFNFFDFWQPQTPVKAKAA